MDDVQAVRALYRALRTHGAAHTCGLAYLLWERAHGRRRTAFMVTSDGTCVPFDRVALIASYRLMLLQQGFPVEYVAKFDRTDN